MSSFIRLSEPSAASLGGKSAAPMYLCADDQSTSIKCAPASDLQLCNNTAEGATFRFNVVLVSSSPPLFALSTQMYGSAKWVSYDPASPTLTLSDTVSDGEIFSILACDPITNACSLYNVYHNVYLSAYVMDSGAIGIHGVDSQSSESQFVMDCTLGTGPVMPNRPYYIKSFGGQTVCANATGWFLSDQVNLADERIVFESVSQSAPHFYRLKTSLGHFIAITDTGSVYMTDLPEGSEAVFQLVPSATIMGSFQFINVAHNLCVRAATGGKLETGYRFDSLARDMFSLATETPGPDPSTSRKSGWWSFLVTRMNNKIPQPSQSSMSASFALKVADMPLEATQPRLVQWCASKTVTVTVISLCLLLLLMCAQIYFTLRN